MRKPFLVFNDPGHTRSKRESTVESNPPSGLPEHPRILVVDGVTTFGNAPIQAERAIESQLPHCAGIDFYVYAVDLARLSSAHPELIARTRFHADIENQRVWLRFPWDAK